MMTRTTNDREQIDITRRQLQKLLDCSPGVGFIAYKSAANAVTVIKFYVDNDGVLRNIATGTPLLPLEVRRDDDQR